MPSTFNVASFLFALLLLVGAATAQTASDALDNVSAEDCVPLADSPSDILRGRLGEQYDNAITGLLIDALIRQCAAIGAIPAPERPGDGGTRSTTSQTEESEADRLAAEARYLVETAMQIDPDAANDLLRRLLGPRPTDDG